MRKVILFLSIGFILGRLLPPMFTHDTRIQPVESNVAEQRVEDIIDGSIQIYDFKTRFSGTNVIFTISCIAYSTDNHRVDIGTARLRTRLCPFQTYDGEWEWVTPDRMRVRRTGEDTLTATVIYPHNPENQRRDFQFCAECEVYE